MEGLNIVDGVVIVIVLISAILAFARGVTREIMAIMGWIISSIIAFIFAPLTTPLIKEIPLLGPILADSCELAIIAAFASVFALSLLIFSFFTPLLSTVIIKTRLTKIDQALVRIKDGTYGFCAETGEPIGLKRLMARPVAKYTIAAQEKHEKNEKVHADD